MVTMTAMMTMMMHTTISTTIPIGGDVTDVAATEKANTTEVCKPGLRVSYQKAKFCCCCLRTHREGNSNITECSELYSQMSGSVQHGSDNLSRAEEFCHLTIFDKKAERRAYETQDSRVIFLRY